VSWIETNNRPVVSSRGAEAAVNARVKRSVEHFDRHGTIEITLDSPIRHAEPATSDLDEVFDPGDLGCGSHRPPPMLLPARTARSWAGTSRLRVSHGVRAQHPESDADWRR
jgi:hypothetical protein